MTTFIIFLHIISSIFLILVVLLQTGKGAEMGVSFGGAAQTLFGSAGPASFLNKLTAIVAGIFMVCSLTLSYLSAHPFSRSIIEKPVKFEEKLPLLDNVPKEEEGNTKKERTTTKKAASLDKTEETEAGNKEAADFKEK